MLYPRLINVVKLQSAALLLLVITEASLHFQLSFGLFVNAPYYYSTGRTSARMETTEDDETSH